MIHVFVNRSLSAYVAAWDDVRVFVASASILKFEIQIETGCRAMESAGIVVVDTNLEVRVAVSEEQVHDVARFLSDFGSADGNMMPNASANRRYPPRRVFPRVSTRPQDGQPRCDVVGNRPSESDRRATAD